MKTNEFMRKNKGITLIALVVTIIVLLILAGVSIQMLTGQTGILKQAQIAKQRTEIAQADEEQKLEQIEQLIENNDEAPNILEDFKKNSDKYKKPSSQTETDDVGISEDGTILDMDLWNYEIDEETESFELVGFIGGCYGSPAFTFKPNEKGGYEGIKITTNSEGKKVAEFIGGIPTYLRTNNKIYILKTIGLGGLSWITEDFGFNEIKINIPNTVTKLSIGAFMGCYTLMELKLPEGIETIESYAFMDCGNLVNIILPNSLKSIGYQAFNNCRSLKEITIPDSVITVEENAFCLCEELVKVKISCMMKEIARSMFNSCYNLKEITIPENVKNIEDYAFYRCDLLSTINYKGTREQWEEISIEEKNDALKNANINYEYKD